MSSQIIEGGTLSNGEVERLPSNLQIKTFPARDEQEVAGYAEVMDLVFWSWQDITLTLHVDGKKAGKGRVEQTAPIQFSAEETCDTGNELGSPVTKDYPNSRKFTGEVNWLEIGLGKDAGDLDHLITPEERFKVAMAKQYGDSGPAVRIGPPVLAIPG